MKTAGLVSALALSVFATSVAAQQADGPPAVIRETDARMTCRQMADEAAALSQGMGGSPRGGLLGRLSGVAQAGAAMFIPGAGLAMAGADALTSGQRERRQAEAEANENRWYYLNGLYAGQGCTEGGPQTAETLAPAEPSARAVAPVETPAPAGVENGSSAPASPS